MDSFFGKIKNNNNSFLSMWKLTLGAEVFAKLNLDSKTP
jgi:hypothetical protein